MCVEQQGCASLTSQSGTVGSCRFFHSFLGMTFMGMSWVTMRLLLDTDTCQDKNRNIFFHVHTEGNKAEELKDNSKAKILNLRGVLNAYMETHRTCILCWRS